MPVTEHLDASPRSASRTQPRSGQMSRLKDLLLNADSEKPAAVDAYDAMDRVYIERYTLELKLFEEVNLRNFDKKHNLPFVERRKPATRTAATFPEAKPESISSRTGDMNSSRVLDLDSSSEDD